MMRSNKSLPTLFAAASLVLAVSCTQSSVPETKPAPKAEPPADARAMTADELAVQQAVSNKLSDAMLAGDMEAVGSCFSEDAVLLPQDAPMAEGREAIVEVFAALPPLSSISSAVHEGVIYGDTAVVRGSVTLVMQVPEVGDVESTAKFVEVREKQDDGSWVLIRDIFNFDAPLGG